MVPGDGSESILQRLGKVAEVIAKIRHMALWDVAWGPLQEDAMSGCGGYLCGSDDPFLALCGFLEDNLVHLLLLSRGSARNERREGGLSRGGF